MCHQHITMQKSYHVQAYKNHEIVNELDVHTEIIIRDWKRDNNAQRKSDSAKVEYL